jgi:hypothetical protein
MSRPLRYVVEFNEADLWGQQLRISYNCGIGNREARAYAIQAGCGYGGRVLLQLMDDSFELIRDYTHRRYHEPTVESQKTTAVSV